MHGPQPSLAIEQRVHASWAWLPLAAAMVLGAVWLIIAFAEPFSVQDDARQHVAWLEAFRDPTLFQGDYIASYFVNSNTPVFKSLYQAVAWLGVSPLVAAKLFPVAITLLTAWLAFRFVRSLGVDGFASALGAALFVQALWFSDDLASATARAFSWPLMMAVLVAWRESRPLLGAVIGFVLSLTYPSAAVFAGALIGLVSLYDWRNWRQAWAEPALVVSGLFLGALVTLALGAGGDLVSATEARRMAEFGDDGRTELFVSNPVTFWLLSKRTGLLPEPVVRHALALVAALAAAWHWRHVPVQARRICLAALAAGLVLWAAAHIVLFSLYLPGRYSLIGIRMVVCVLAGVGIAAWLQAAGPRLRMALTAVLIGFPLLALAVPPRALGLVSVPKAPAVLAALGNTPPQTLVAGISPDLDAIPAGVQRRVLTAREYHLPYNRAYGQEMRRRLAATAAAVFADGPVMLNVLHQRYGVDYLLLDREQIAPEGMQKSWWLPVLAQMKAAPRCTAESCRVWALEQSACIVAEQNSQVLLSVDCLLGRRMAAKG